jgi:ribonuclease HI
VIEAYFDGCCEPVNPGGTAAYGAVVFIDGTKVWEDSRIFYPADGQTSNNIAEYSGFKAILEYLLGHRLNDQPIVIRGDSNLVIQQMFGTWRIKQGLYVSLALDCVDLLSKFPHIEGRWIPRVLNTFADELSKKRLLEAGVKFRIQPQSKLEAKDEH